MTHKDKPGSEYTAVLVFLGCLKISHTGWFKQQKCISHSFVGKSTIRMRPGQLMVRALSLVCRQPPLHCVLIRPFLCARSRGKHGLVQTSTFPKPGCHCISPQDGSIGDCWCFLPAAKTTVRKQHNI